MTNQMVPLEWAAQVVATLMSQIDEATGSELDAALVQAFSDATVDLKTRITRRQLAAEAVAAEQIATKNYIADAKKHLVRLENIEKAMKADAIKTVATLPGVELRGSSGKKMYVKKNAPKLIPDEGIVWNQSFSNVVNPIAIELHKIEENYLKRISAYQLDTEAVKADLKAGVQLDWVHLEQGQSIVGLFPPAKEHDND